MEYPVDTSIGGPRTKPVEIKPLPEIKQSKARRLYEKALKFFITILRAFLDAKEATKNKKKELVDWIKRILDLLIRLIPK